MSYKDSDWYKAQERVYQWLKNHKIRVYHAGFFSPFDIHTAAMTRIDVKWSRYQTINENMGSKQKGWKFVLHKQGHIDESQVDFYVCLCDVNDELTEIGILRPFYLVIKTPVNKFNIAVTTRDLLAGRWVTNFDNSGLIKEFDATKPPLPPPSGGKPGRPRRRIVAESEQ